MSGKAKIESLTNSWYGYATFTAAVALLHRGLGLFSLIWTGLGLMVTWFVMFLVGRALLGRSSLVRMLLICISGILTVLGGLKTGTLVLAFASHFDLGTLATAALAAVGVWMNAKSLKTLLDPQVKSYIG